MIIPELLAPAGTFEKMQYALAYGADAVYIGMPKFSLRARENDFNWQTTAEAVGYAQRLGKKIYITMNIYPHNRKVESFLAALEQAAALKPDGLIMADVGMIMLAREKHPQLPIHLSTQANTVNWPSVKFWQNLGVRRIILSRELGMDEISEIRQRAPDIELEIFVHGAICIAYSGRCLLSNYFNHRDANQGACTNACRWEYQLYGARENAAANPAGAPATKADYYLEESERPGELLPLDEDEHGTYIMNAKDLSTIHILEQLLKTGVDSFKIEGRTKSLYYVSIVTRAYRRALDLLSAGQPLSQELLAEVFAVANREYVTGFLERNPLQDGQNYASSQSDLQTKTFCGIIHDWNAGSQLATVRVRNRFDVGDSLELVTPQAIIPFTVNEIWDMEGKSIRAAHGGGKDVRLRLPAARPEAFALLRIKFQNT